MIKARVDTDKLKEILYNNLDMLFDKLEAQNEESNRLESEIQEDFQEEKKRK